MAYIGEMQYLTIGNNTYSLPTGGGGDGTVTSVGVSNATNGGLSVSGSPITSNGTITIGHSNILSSAQTTQAVYPIKIDKNGHISAYGSAVTIPTKTSDLTNDSGFITNSGLNNYLEKSYTGSNQTGSIGWYTDDNNNNNIYLLTQVNNTNESTSSYIGLESGSVGLSTTYNEDEDSFTGEITVEGKRVDIGFSNGSGVGDTLYYFTIDEYNGYNFRSINNHDYYNIYMPQNKSGTVALTSDIPKVYSSTNTGGYLTMATLPIYDGMVV